MDRTDLPPPPTPTITVPGWQDARWTLRRVAEVIERRFGVSYSCCPSPGARYRRNAALRRYQTV
ncbi:winged helix-turn-helix domain-containing protein [Actinoplanes sp. NPDC023801]|uniref:winged helix-turn-helix domain-containing protein n=1 Tax=Actinoplanes sp. NPDC023801 TaxID=3154595 RepID=UPI0033D40B14